MPITTELLHGDCRELLPTLEAESVQTIVTSPPYWMLRRYTTDPREIGREPTPAAYITALTDVFTACYRVLRQDGTLWIVIGDTYANDSKWGGKTGGKHAGGLHGAENGMRERKHSGLPDGNLIGVPWRLAFALQDAGWILRNEIVWHKPNAMPAGNAAKHRCGVDHETVFLFAKQTACYFDAQAIAEPVVDSDRPQRRRAIELANEAGLTNAHIDAIRAVGCADAGKAKVTQTGTGKNAPETQRLADEAKAALGGYYREFLTASSAHSFKRNGNKRSQPVVPGNTATHRPDRDDVQYDQLTRHPRTVWSIATTGLSDEHYAPMPQALAERCIRAGSAAGDIVLDPFAGSGTTGRAALALQRSAVLIDLSYTDMQERRTDGVQVELFV